MCKDRLDLLQRNALRIYFRIIDRRGFDRRMIPVDPNAIGCS